MLTLILLIVALVLFLIAAIGPIPSQVNLVALGLFLATLAYVLSTRGVS